MYNILFMLTQLVEVFAMVALIGGAILMRFRKRTRALLIFFGASYLPSLYLRLRGSMSALYMEPDELFVFVMTTESMKLIRGIIILIFMGFLFFKGMVSFKQKSNFNGENTPEIS